MRAYDRTNPRGSAVSRLPEPLELRLSRLRSFASGASCGEVEADRNYAASAEWMARSSQQGRQLAVGYISLEEPVASPDNVGSTRPPSESSNCQLQLSRIFRFALLDRQVFEQALSSRSEPRLPTMLMADRWSRSLFSAIARAHVHTRRRQDGDRGTSSHVLARCPIWGASRRVLLRHDPLAGGKNVESSCTIPVWRRVWVDVRSRNLRKKEIYSSISISMSSPRPRSELLSCSKT